MKRSRELYWAVDFSTSLTMSQSPQNFQNSFKAAWRSFGKSETLKDVEKVSERVYWVSCSEGEDWLPEHYLKKQFQYLSLVVPPSPPTYLQYKEYFRFTISSLCLCVCMCAVILFCLDRGRYLNKFTNCLQMKQVPFQWDIQHLNKSHNLLSENNCLHEIKPHYTVCDSSE